MSSKTIEVSIHAIERWKQRVCNLFDDVEVIVKEIATAVAAALTNGGVHPTKEASSRRYTAKDPVSGVKFIIQKMGSAWLVVTCLGWMEEKETECLLVT